MISTTREQAARLIACGVDPKTADMSLISSFLHALPYRAMLAQFIGDGAMKGKKLTAEDFELIPAWSLSKLLSLIPHVIEVYDDGDYYFSLAQEFPASEDYHAAYKYCWADDDALVGKRDNDPIEACVQLIEWLTANGYKLNTNQQ